MHLPDRARDARRSDDVSDPPARNAVRLGHPVHNDRPLPHAVYHDRRDVLLAVIDDVFVDFVGDGQNIPLLAKVSDQLKFLAAEDLSGRIVRRINNDGLRLVVEGPREFFFIEGPVRLAELHVARRGAGDNRVGPVVFVERLEYDDLVAWIDDGQQHVDHRFGGTTRNGDLALRIDVETHELLRFVHQRIAEALRDALVYKTKKFMGLDIGPEREITELLRFVH